MRLIANYLKNYKKIFLLNLLSVFGFALVELGIPTIVAQMIDKGVTTNDPSYILKMGGVIVIISIVGVGGTILMGYCCAFISTGITCDIRNDMFRKIQGFSNSEYQKFGAASLITRTNNDAFQIQMFMNILFRTALMTPVMIFVSFTLVLRTSLPLSLIIISTVPVIIIGVLVVAKISEPLSENQQLSMEAINRISKENLSGIRVIRAFNNDPYEQKRFNEANNQYMKYSKKLFKLMSLTQPIFFFLMNIAGMGIFWVAANMIHTGQLEIGQLVAFMDYLFHAMFSVMLFCLVFMMYPRARVSAKRIEKVMNQEVAIKNQEDGIPLEGEVEEVVWDHVTFVYPDGEEAVLKDISFSAKKGETIAFIGSTGSGKSTLINLIPRAYDVSGGSIRINGRDIREFNLASLRDAIGFIPQKTMLFRGTIADNIRFGKEDATDQEVEQAARTAQAYDFIMEKGGFDENITESATNISGGQKQRLSIARALVKRPKIYIFDDSFSALDFKTDATLRRELKKETMNAIVMVVAQRVASIMDADQIVVLNEGKIVGMGTHRELLKSCSIYHEIAVSQLSEEELANA
ncbi:ABC transporter ATP-binding protein [Lactonifactor longoviformis]|uniref:ATP-binding cassette, subfamily B, multidrug efflux pump n=1 Tax=Lactonifactor longoviformis DSM 17459 TaxID=1122155 RepID=A0A1M4XQG1_9CLOT|nr:ABC transporter ATP-binding protein [Lactonifactor longoviformis]POP34914.1 ABC transporter ATP-binding protein [Lactonifactor longoviformis]SHE95685.1 ATP-binding cassette, subfamily B, multidrug efflux pump [Lactonifactor longoviformis DSM 17459]